MIKAFARYTALVAVLAVPLAASADEKSSGTSVTNKKTKLADEDLQVLAHVHKVNQMEIDMGRMAQHKGSNAAIKGYGKTLVTDHQQNDKDVMALAKKRGQTIPKEAASNEMERNEEKDNMDAMKRLQTLKGTDFDRELLQIAVQGHEKELSRTDTAIGQVQDDDVKQLLKDMKPVLQHHADMARDLQKTNAQASTQQPPSR
jgi:putative membrane protein